MYPKSIQKAVGTYLEPYNTLSVFVYKMLYKNIKTDPSQMKSKMKHYKM